jgi:hypothetical protein
MEANYVAPGRMLARLWREPVRSGTLPTSHSEVEQRAERAGDVGMHVSSPFCSLVRALSSIEDIQRVCAIIDEVDSLAARNDGKAEECA